MASPSSGPPSGTFDVVYLRRVYEALDEYIGVRQLFAFQIKTLGERLTDSNVISHAEYHQILWDTVEHYDEEFDRFLFHTQEEIDRATDRLRSHIQGIVSIQPGILGILVYNMWSSIVNEHVYEDFAARFRLRSLFYTPEGGLRELAYRRPEGINWFVPVGNVNHQ